VSPILIVPPEDAGSVGCAGAPQAAKRLNIMILTTSKFSFFTSMGFSPLSFVDVIRANLDRSLIYAFSQIYLLFQANYLYHFKNSWLTWNSFPDC
jgi:hypothetical protein